ncbi:MAG: hypothetical protein JWM89_618 [Acidimicrobiales bacterium]|nr:hypothetical protein [Acidimicrobiales bacterium]
MAGTTEHDFDRRDWLGTVGIAAIPLLIVTILAATYAGVRVYRHHALRPAHGRSSDACSAPGSVAMLAFDLRTGEPRWSNIVTDRSELMSRRGVVQAVDGHTARTVDPATGAVTSCRRSSRQVDARPDLEMQGRWFAGRRIPLSVPAAGHPLLVGGCGPRQIAAIQLTDGAVLWKRTMAGTVGTRAHRVGSRFVVPDGPGAHFDVLDADTGRELWRVATRNPAERGRATGPGVLTSALVVDREHLLIVTVAADFPEYAPD